MSEPAPLRFRFPGVTAYVDRMVRRLAGSPSAAELAEIHRSITTTSRRLEVSLTTKRVATSQLMPASRSLRAWLAFMADRAGFDAYNAAVAGCTAAVGAGFRSQRRWKPPASVFFQPRRGLYQARQARAGFELSLPTAAVSFGADGWAVVVRCVVLGDKSAKREFIDLTLGDAYRAVAAELDALGGVERAAGRVYDLDAVFDRVNAEYFAGGMKRPKLAWSRSPTFRKFGHYDWIGDTVMLSRTLDAEGVPEFVVDFVMYHELLHKAHGIRWTSDSARGYAHTAAFYRDEKRFRQFDAAEAEIKRLAAGGRRKRR